MLLPTLMSISSSSTTHFKSISSLSLKHEGWKGLSKIKVLSFFLLNYRKAILHLHSPPYEAVPANGQTWTCHQFTIWKLQTQDTKHKNHQNWVSNRLLLDQRWWYFSQNHSRSLAAAAKSLFVLQDAPHICTFSWRQQVSYPKKVGGSAVCVLATPDTYITQELDSNRRSLHDFWSRSSSRHSHTLK